ncbi:MAG: hypothetical protein ACLFRG_22710 [Desulfococcaceae bacterium]
MTIENEQEGTVNDARDKTQAETRRTAGTSSAPFSELVSLFLANPLTGQRKILERLSETNQWIGGGGLAFLNVLGLYLLIIGLIRGIFGAWARLTAGNYFGFFVVSLIPVGALFGGFLLLGRMGGGGRTDTRQSLFKAGFSLFPTTAALFLGWLWLAAVGIVQVAPLILAFGLSFSLLLMFGALRELPALNEKTAFFFTPLLVSIAIILAGVMAAIVL